MACEPMTVERWHDWADLCASGDPDLHRQVKLALEQREQALYALADIYGNIIQAFHILHDIRLQLRSGGRMANDEE